MSIGQIIILSLIQGLTEFLPVSSSGHLIFLPKLLGWQDQGLEMDVAVHIGTLCSVCCFFWQDLKKMIIDTLGYILSGFHYRSFTSSVKLSIIIVIATIPAIIIGLMLKKYGMNDLRSTQIIALASIIFGILLYIADRMPQLFLRLNQLSRTQGLVIGLAQALAFIPGASRSGVCITAARFLKIDRPTAARFAFLLSIPTILGAGVATGYSMAKQGHPLLTEDFLYAIFFSFIFGLLAIKFMIHYVSRYSLSIFVIYRVILGGVLLLFSFLT